MPPDGTMNNELQVSATSNPFKPAVLLKGSSTITCFSILTAGYLLISMDLWRAQYKRHQSLYEDLAGKVSLVAALLGGSQLYYASDSHDSRNISDWDGALFVAKKLDIVVLVNEYRQLLMDLLDVRNEEYPPLCVPGPSSSQWDKFHAVRFAGFTETGAKKSVKILSKDYFMENETHLNILSFKDRRVYESFALRNKFYYRIQQATCLENDLCILHDQWIFQAQNKVCVHGNINSRTAFGVTADLIMTGAWLFGEDFCGQFVQKKLLQAFTTAAKRPATVENFARCCRFSQSHVRWLGDRLKRLSPSIDLSDRCGCSETESLFLYGTNSNKPANTTLGTRSRIRCLPKELAVLGKIQEFTARPQRALSIFSSNSINLIATVALDSDKHSKIKMFCKHSPFQAQEIWGANQAALYFPLVQIPRLHASGYLLYLFFEGRSEAERRLTFIQTGQSDRELLETIVHTELAKAEDTLRAYRQSFQDPAKHSKRSKQPIHRFFHDRVVNNVRFREFYNDGVQVHQHLVPLRSFLRIPFEINKVCYPSLDEISRNAAAVLDPSAVASCPTVFGLGDTHGANILISEKRRPDHRRELLYIDYEAAGYHSVMLDLAKPFYNDIFFQTLYADHIPNPPGIDYELKEGVIRITLSPCEAPIGQAILVIRRRLLILPLFVYAQAMHHDLEQHVPQLASALFACACLTRNFAGDWGNLFRNLAAGVMFSQVSTLEGLWGCCCDSLGMQ